MDRAITRTEQFLAALRTLIDTGRMPDGVGRLGYPTAVTNGRPRIWVASHRPRMLRLTGRYADGWVPFEFDNVQQYAMANATIARHAAEAGRPSPEPALLVFTVLGESRDRVIELFESAPMTKALALFSTTAHDWQSLGYRHPLSDDSRGYQDYIPHEVDAETLNTVVRLIPDEILERRILLGNAEEVAARLRPYQQAGCEHVIMLNVTGLVNGVADAEIAARQMIDLVRILHHLGEPQSDTAKLAV
jgi:phthiodiolone/phenolphthiodiolone dimycocerosates ketoreductase